EVEALELDINVRLDFFLIFKESVNNLIKYSKASFAEINIILEDQHLKMSVTDNGVGFDLNNYRPGIGLENIHKRARQINGTITIKSALNEGTSVVLQIPVSSFNHRR